MINIMGSQHAGELSGYKYIYPMVHFVIKGLIFSKILANDTQSLARKDEIWSVFCEFKVKVPLQLMMTSSNGNIFRVTGRLCGEFTGDRWIPLTTASDAELWCFFFIRAWINDWVNTREAGDLRRHRAHYDVIMMCFRGGIITHSGLMADLCISELGHHWFR